ncbi:amidohydrolase [Jiangella ureilytica]|uniref:Amidohydrolase n=1 Tax=Jiangella ureilytica TaxID=2530374 RepID=A0A4V2XVP8_9ACTN|nr:amidohydrolase family protein [Jiangella ureilytica]TDC46145.1 amidohydrolase [Jiangella ureilytica]
MFDVHTHCHQPEHWGPEWRAHWAPVYGQEEAHAFTPEEYDEAMKGVSVACVFGLRATAAGVATPNEYVEWFCKNTSTNTIGFMALDPTDDDVLEQMADGVARGLRGIKLYPVLSLFDARDSRFDAFYEAATSYGLVILWHMGATPSPAGSLLVSQPLVVDEVARRHPDLTMVMAHMGHPWQREAMVVCRKNRRVFTDVSASWARPFDGYHALVRAQEWGVVDKLLFGSDFPIWTPAQAVAGLREIAAMRPPTLPYVLPSTLEWLLDGDPREALGLL